MGRHFHRPNESLTLETNANRRPAGKTLLTPLLHMHAMVFKTPVNSAEKHLLSMHTQREEDHHKMNQNDD